jgi:hypothetical protein
MTNETLLEITERINLLRLIINALFKDLTNYDKYLTDEERVSIFLLLEDKPLNELLLMYRTQDFITIVDALDLLNHYHTKGEED